jgi:sugar/nucleoside kinase (ribokinase family)
MQKHFDVIVSGHLCLDLIPEIDNVPLQALATPGRLYESGPMRFSTGGAVSNTGLALHRLGVPVGLMAAIGDDLLGQAILSIIRARDESLTELITVQPGLVSSYTVVLAPGKADRIFLHHTGPNQVFGFHTLDFDILARTRIFHLGYPPLLPRLVAAGGREMQQIYQQVKSLGVVTSLDMTLPDPGGPSGRADWGAIMDNTLPYVDIFIPSIEEIIFMLRRSDFDNWGGNVLNHLSQSYLSALADELLARGVAITGFKLGEMGIYLKTAGADRLRQLNHLNLDATAWGSVEMWQPAFEVDVAGTVGAGDAAYAGFLGALLRAMPPAQSLRWACAVGACNVEAADSISGVRSWSETQDRLQAGWPARRRILPGM